MVTSQPIAINQEIPEIRYDGLHRVTAVEYGELPNTDAEDFVYDDMSNRLTYRDNRASLTTQYASNEVNEYTTIGGFDAEHDDAGKLTRQEIDGTGREPYPPAPMSAECIEDEPSNPLMRQAGSSASRTPSSDASRSTRCMTSW